MTNRIVFKRLHDLYRNQHLRAAVLLAVVLAFFYRDVIFEGRTFLMQIAAPGTMPSGGGYRYDGIQPRFAANDPGAIAWMAEPLNRFIAVSLKNGDFPLWNPYAGLAGTPLLADGQTAPLEPIQFIFFFLPIRFWTYAVDAQLLIRFFLAAYFCYLFVRRQNVEFAGAVSAGVLFALSSYFVTYGNHPQIKTEALLPLVLYGYDRLVHPDDRHGFWICALSIGWAILAGMPEGTFFSLLLGSLWYFYKSILLLEDGRELLPKARNIFLRYLGPTSLGFLVSAAYLLPFLEFVSLSAHIHSAGEGGSPLPLWMLPVLVFRVRGYFHLQLGLFSLFPLLYLLIHLKDFLVKYRRTILFFGVYAIVAGLAIFDFPPANWIRRLPALNQVVYEKYSIPSIVFSLAVLMGVFIDGIAHAPLSFRKMAFVLLVAFMLFAYLPSLGNPDRAMDAYLDSGEALRFVLGYILSGGGILFLLLFLYRLRDITPCVLQAGLLLLMVAAEPFFWNSNIIRPSRTDPFRSPPFVDYLREDPELFRIFALDGILHPNISTAHRIGDIRWLNALVPRRTFDFSAKFIESREVKTIRFTGVVLPISYEMFDLLNVKYVLIEKPGPSPAANVVVPVSEYALVHQSAGVQVYRNDGFLPRAFVAHNVLNVPDFDRALAALERPGLDPARTAVVENLPVEIEHRINANDAHMQPTPGNAEITRSGEMTVRVSTAAPGLLVVTEQYYPGWKAYVNGKETTIYAVNGIFRGIFLEEGVHSIEFKYRPLSFTIGGGISALALSVTVFLWLVEPRRANRRTDP